MCFGRFEYLHLNHEILALYTYHMEEDYFNEHNIVQLAHMSGIPVCYGQITEDEMLSYMERRAVNCFCGGIQPQDSCAG